MAAPGDARPHVDVQAFDIDLFDNHAMVVRALHRNGRRVVSYLDAGTGEKWRPDASAFPNRVLSRPSGWPGKRCALGRWRVACR